MEHVQPIYFQQGFCSATKQTISLTLATTVGHFFLRDLDFAKCLYGLPSCGFFFFLHYTDDSEDHFLR